MDRVCTCKAAFMVSSRGRAPAQRWLVLELLVTYFHSFHHQLRRGKNIDML